MSTYNKLCDIYRRWGFRVVAGVPQAFSTSTSTEFAWLFQNGFPLTHHLGISPQEIYFFESLFEHLHPRNILVIGNAFGWSSLALAILNPNARVLTIEIGEEKFTKSWIEKSNKIADAEGLRSRTALGRSPDDTQDLIRKHLGPVDFCFIDGAHSPEQLEQISRPSKLLLRYDRVCFSRHC